LILQSLWIAFGEIGLYGRFAQHETERAADARIGKMRERARNLIDVPQPCDIGKRDGERRAPFRPAQNRHGFHKIPGFVCARGILYSMIYGLPGTGLPKFRQGFAIAERKAAEIGTIAEGARQHLPRRYGYSRNRVTQGPERPFCPREIKHPRQGTYSLREGISNHRHFKYD
jgi:hypothetical protein